MKNHRTWGVGAVLVLAAVYFFVFSAVKFNLAAASAAATDVPVTIIIDAGHGGEDGGATSVSGVQESQLNLAISLRLEQLLALTGFQASMIRETDTAVYSGDCSTITEKKVSDLKNRVATINAVPNGLVVSIHQNHFSESKYSGAQVFYAASGGSKELAGLMQARLRETLAPSNKREPKAASSVYLMEHIQCTGILIECGFLSNPQEDLLLQDPDYQKKLVCAIGCALTEYLNKGDVPFEV